MQIVDQSHRRLTRSGGEALHLVGVFRSEVTFFEAAARQDLDSVSQ
jgi:hypothetical protein